MELIFDSELNLLDYLIEDSELDAKQAQKDCEFAPMLPSFEKMIWFPPTDWLSDNTDYICFD